MVLIHDSPAQSAPVEKILSKLSQSFWAPQFLVCTRLIVYTGSSRLNKEMEIEFPLISFYCIEIIS